MRLWRNCPLFSKRYVTLDKEQSDHIKKQNKTKQNQNTAFIELENLSTVVDKYNQSYILHCMVLLLFHNGILCLLVVVLFLFLQSRKFQ